jgi:hypothetical protein
MGIRMFGRCAALGAVVACTSVASAAEAGGLTIEAHGPQSATAGSLVALSFVVGNDGEQSYAAPLAVAGSRCVGAPVLLTKDGDASPGALDPGDRWTFVCQMQVGDAGARNVATVTATDAAGREASASADASTRIVGQAVSPVTIVSPGRAALRAPAGCVRSRLMVPRVTGRRIMQVVWFVDGRAVSVRTKPDADGRWRRALRLRELRYGTHRVRAVVQFVPESVTAPQALTLRFSRCRPPTRPGGSSA